MAPASAEDGPGHERGDHHERADHDEQIAAVLHLHSERVVAHGATVPLMSTYESILVERDDHGVVTVTMNRPEKKNALSTTMVRELTEVFDEITDSRTDRVLVLTGAGDAFTSGADLTPDTKSGEQAMIGGGAGSALASMRRLGRLVVRLHDIPKPTIAAVNGVAVGAGCNLALGCDLIIAADAARFSEIFARRGLSLDGGGSWLLPRLIGLHKAKELAFLAEIISAEEAERYGIVNRVVPAGELAKVVDDLAHRIAAQPPIQISITKKLLNQSLSVSMAEAVEFEDVAQSLAFSSRDTAEAMAAFIEKRDPEVHRRVALRSPGPHRSLSARHPSRPLERNDGDGNLIRCETGATCELIVRCGLATQRSQHRCTVGTGRRSRGRAQRATRG